MLVLPASGERQDVLDAVKAGATGYLLKSVARGEFLDAVRRTAEGDAVCTPGPAGLVLGEYRELAAAAGEDTPQLTAREAEGLWPVAKGLTGKQIAGGRRSRTAPCRTTSRTRCASCGCTTASSRSGTPSRRAWTGG